MTTHYAEFLKKIDAGVPPAIYCHQAEGKNFFRLYDGNSRFPGNHNHHACVASKLAEEEAQSAVDLATASPREFAERYL